MDFNPVQYNLENEERRLLEYLSPALRQVLDFQQINAASEPEIRLAWQALSRVLGNQFLAEADAAGLAVWERELGIYPKAGDGLAVRRARIKAAWLRKPPYTLRWLREWLDGVCGAGNYSVGVQDYTINIVLEYDRLNEPSVLLRDILELLRPLRPSQMLVQPAMTAEAVFPEYLNQKLLLPSVQMAFYFFNQPNDVTLLNGRRTLDGSWRLDQAFRGVVMQTVKLVLPWREQFRPMAAGSLLAPEIKLPNHNRAFWPKVNFVSRMFNQNAGGSKSLGINSRFASGQPEAQGGSLTRDTMWRLDGEMSLNGSKKLNAAIVTEEL